MLVCYPSRYVTGTEDGKGQISKPQALSFSGKTGFTPQSVVRPLQRAMEGTALSLEDKSSPGTRKHEDRFIDPELLTGTLVSDPQIHFSAWGQLCFHMH